MTKHELESRVIELEIALITATACVRDLANGWPVKELACSPELLMAELTRLIPNHDVSPL